MSSRAGLVVKKKQAGIPSRSGAKYSEEMSYQRPQKGWREWKDPSGRTPVDWADEEAPGAVVPEAHVRQAYSVAISVVW